MYAVICKFLWTSLSFILRVLKAIESLEYYGVDTMGGYKNAISKNQIPLWIPVR